VGRQTRGNRKDSVIRRLGKEGDGRLNKEVRRRFELWLGTPCHRNLVQWRKGQEKEPRRKGKNPRNKMSLEKVTRKERKKK